ncbi:MAG: SET domain-containing protein [Patescibacteria group bacterium]
MKKDIKYPEALIEIRPSKMLPGEIGVFACTDIKKDTIVALESVFKSKLYSWDKFDKMKLSKKTIEKIMSFCLGTKDGIFLPENINNISIPWEMNHSCNGNVGFNQKDDFVAIKDIKNGEELCWDYGLGESNPSFSMNCSCGGKECRKIITGNDWKDLKKSYKKDYMISYLRN